MARCSRRMFLTLLATTAVLPTAAAQTSGPVVRETDAAARDPALVKVRAAIVAAVKAKDFKQLEPHLDPNILIVFGGSNGAAAFAESLRTDPVMWDELDWVLAHGGRFLEGKFWAPYTYQAKVGSIDVYDAGFIVADNVPARAEAKADAAVVATLSHHVVKVTDWREPEKAARPFYNRQDWIRIELPAKRSAWVEARYVRGMGDYRAGFAKIRGVWKLNAFVRGD